MSNFKARWHFIYASPRQEHQVAIQLPENDFRAYQPLATEKHHRFDCLKTVSPPIFLSYVFAYLNNMQKTHISDEATDGISSIEAKQRSIEVADHPFRRGQKLTTSPRSFKCA